MGTRRARLISRAWVFGIGVSVLGRPGHAAEPVHVSCDELTPEQAAEIEARARANLLTETGAGVEVRIRCELGTASVLAIAGDRSASAVLGLPQPTLVDALLEAVEKTLEELEQRALAPSVEAAPPVAPAAPPVAARPPPCAPRVGASRVPERPPRPSLGIALGAAALSELWSGHFAAGGRVLVAANGPRWSAAAAVGGLTSVTHPSAFTPAEWHALVFASFEPEGFAGFRATAGAGVSTLVATPHSPLVASSGTALPAPFGELDLERPVHAGRLALVPALGLRVAARRDVVVDGASRLVLPVVVPQAVVALTYAL